MTEPDHVPIDPQLVDEVVSTVRHDGVLVGGQALAVWLTLFGLSRFRSDDSPITMDADFLGGYALLNRIASTLPGSALFENPRDAFSRLIGVVKVPIPGNHFMTIDVIDAVPPLSDAHIFAGDAPVVAPALLGGCALSCNHAALHLR